MAFAELTEEQMKAYIATGEPFDKAGGYGIQVALNKRTDIFVDSRLLVAYWSPGLKATIRMLLGIMIKW